MLIKNFMEETVLSVPGLLGILKTGVWGNRKSGGTKTKIMWDREIKTYIFELS